ncbi:UNVERIFIED_CONTAM: hypothetical protein PYX00_004063 [Menopon gallinae]|uniref:THO complex subunit 7 n=1 Tax=Menopon gallinae TaxID=328185 RepID=A0AAW2I3V9_9NEOP
MNDEDVIKRRLLIDGDGTGDDRRLNALQKNIIKWCSSTDSQEESQLSLDGMLAQLSHCEFTVKKSRRVAKMNAIELQNYQDLSKKIKQDIEEERKMIENTKTALIEAKIVRKNKMECDILGKVINEQPDRIETGKKLDQLKNELKNLKKCRTQIEKKMMQRRQQFYALVVTIQQLRDIVEEDDSITPTEVINDEPMEDEETTPVSTVT